MVTVRLLMGMLIGTNWRKAGDTTDMDEAQAKELAAFKPPRVEILGLAGSVDAADLATTDEASGSEEEGSGEPDDSLEAFGFAGKTLNLLHAANITTVTDLQAKIDSGEHIEGVGEKTLASIQAQLDAAAE
jgi:hypothetical protein